MCLINTSFIRSFVGIFVIIMFNMTISAQNVGKMVRSDRTQNEMADIALGYISHTEDFVYGGMYTAFRKRVFPIDKKWEINCSTFSMLVALGIKYEDSVYGGGTNKLTNRKAYYKDLKKYMMSGTEGMQSSYVFSENVAQWLYERGFCFYPDSLLSNVETGDILFFNNNTSDDENRFFGIDHSGIFAYHVHDNLWAVWEVQNAGPVYAEYTSLCNSKIVLCARLPKKVLIDSVSCINVEPVKKYRSQERILRPLINKDGYKPGKQYTLVAKINYVIPDTSAYPGIHDANNRSLCSYHSLKKKPVDNIYKIPFVLQEESTHIFLDTRVSINGENMDAECEWAYVYESLLVDEVKKE